MSQKVAWNKDRTKSVVLAKLKEFTISNMEQQSHMAKPWSVRYGLPHCPSDLLLQN